MIKPGELDSKFKFFTSTDPNINNENVALFQWPNNVGVWKNEVIQWDKLT